MKIPKTLILPDHGLQQELNDVLTMMQRPFIHMSIVICAFLCLGIQIAAVTVHGWNLHE